jgi:hypothetical protein
MVAYFEMAAVDDARASGPELFCPIVCVEHNHVGDLWPLRARHANDLPCGEMKGFARPCRNNNALSEMPQIRPRGNLGIARGGRSNCSVAWEAFNSCHRKRRLGAHLLLLHLDLHSSEPCLRRRYEGKDCGQRAAGAVAGAQGDPVRIMQQLHHYRIFTARAPKARRFASPSHLMLPICDQARSELSRGALRSAISKLRPTDPWPRLLRLNLLIVPPAVVFSDGKPKPEPARTQERKR